MFNVWWSKVALVMDMWDQSILLKKYTYLIQKSEDSLSTMFYFKMLFGISCYIFCEINTLLDGQVRSVEQSSFFYKSYLDTAVKGTYSEIKNMFTGKSIMLQKCCRDYFLTKLSVSGLL
jgi:hypothetical protein